MSGKMSDKDYLNVTEVIPKRLYLTSLYGMKNIKDSDNNIIVSILHFNPNLKKSFTKSECIYYNSQDEDSDNIEVYFDQFKELMDNNPDKIVYVHCLYGASRSATLVISYLVHHITNKNHNKIPWLIFLLRKKRSCVYPNEGFINKLKKYRK